MKKTIVTGMIFALLMDDVGGVPQTKWGSKL